MRPGARSYDECARECLAIAVERRMTADVLWVLADFFLECGIPEYIRSDNGPERSGARYRRDSQF